MKVTEDKITELKGLYTKLFKVTRRESDYVFRLPTLKEWKAARQKDTTFSANDKIVTTCLVFPTLIEMRAAEKLDPYLVEVLGLRLMNYILQDDDGDDGAKIEIEGVEHFRINRRGIVYTFRFPTRAEWKRVSGLLGSNSLGSLDVLVTQCLEGVSEAELTSIQEKDVAFTEQVGAPFLKVIIQDWADSEGKEIV